jgi:hypothetical protein
VERSLTIRQAGRSSRNSSVARSSPCALVSGSPCSSTARRRHGRCRGWLAVVGLLVEGVLVQGAHPGVVAAGDAAADEEVAAAGVAGGGAVARVPVNGAWLPGMVAAAFFGEERSPVTTALAHHLIQTYYRTTGSLETTGVLPQPGGP